jgi:hypothetical protein
MNAMNNTTIDIMSILPLLIPLIVVQLVLMVVCLIDLSKRARVRGLPKWAWAIIIVLGELLGPIIYLFVGRMEE